SRLSSIALAMGSGEVFLRGHQGLAGLLLYATWRHLSSHHSTSRLFLIIIFGVFLLMLVLLE
ncbi:hypothetical protein, partial [Klebsiella pneumoniae]|uniref:hypothetical protein n=1 Tax=Klebsiella pneumoniae TaxID=573 RepID=UPI0019543FFB